MISSLSTQVPHISQASRAPQAPKSSESDQVSQEPVDTASLGGCIEKVARKVAGFAVGLVFGTSGLLVNAAAGGAEGLCHGARLEKLGKAGFHTAFAANLALTGLAGGPVGIATGLIGGELMWRLQGEQVRDRVTQGADQWVDAVVNKLPGNPDQAGLPKRLLQGAIGEVVGGAAGVVKGTFGLFKAGQETGEQFVGRIAQDLRN